MNKTNGEFGRGRLMKGAGLVLNIGTNKKGEINPSHEFGRTL